MRTARVAAAGFALLLAGCATPEANRGDGELVLRGTVRAAERWTLAFGVAGVVTDVGVRPGDRVGVGEWIASLDAAPMDRAVGDARARLQAAKVRRASLGGTIWVDNGNPVVPQSVSSEAEQLPTDVGAFDAGVAASAAMLRLAVSQREAAELRSTVAGRVTSVTARPGARIAAGEGAILIENDERFEVVVRVPAPVPSWVRAGGTAQGEWSAGSEVRRAGLRVLDTTAAGDGLDVVLAFAERLPARPAEQIDVRFRN